MRIDCIWKCIICSFLKYDCRLLLKHLPYLLSPQPWARESAKVRQWSSHLHLPPRVPPVESWEAATPINSSRWGCSNCRWKKRGCDWSIKNCFGRWGRRLEMHFHSNTLLCAHAWLCAHQLIVPASISHSKEEEVPCWKSRFRPQHPKFSLLHPLPIEKFAKHVG